MRKIKLDPKWDVPTVEVILSNARKEIAVRAKLVFDTGSELTQVDVDLIESLGYSARDAVGIRRVRGAAGEPVEGYVVPISGLVVFGKKLKDIEILTYDFKNFPGIHGLLGWDLIQQLHLELDGTARLIKVF